MISSARHFSAVAQAERTLLACLSPCRYEEATTPGVSNRATCLSPSVNAPSTDMAVVLVLADTADTCAYGPDWICMRSGRLSIEACANAEEARQHASGAVKAQQAACLPRRGHSSCMPGYSLLAGHSVQKVKTCLRLQADLLLQCVQAVWQLTLLNMRHHQSRRTFWPTRWLTRVDLPELGTPTTPTVSTCSSSTASSACADGESLHPPPPC